MLKWKGLQVDLFFICLRIQGIPLVKQVLSTLVLIVDQSCIAEVVAEDGLATRVTSKLEAGLA